MSRASVCAEAIRLAGAPAVIPGREQSPFFASIQPRIEPQDSGVYPGGMGFSRKYNLYVPCGGSADALREGDTLIWMGARYRVLRLESFCAGGEEILRQGVAVREQEVDA